MSLQDSWLRCPRGGSRLVMEIGQDDTGVAGLTVEHRCLCCVQPYVEQGPTTPRAAARTSQTVIDRVRRLRLEGWTRPLVIDPTPFPTDELAGAST